MRKKGQWLGLLALTVLLAAGFSALELPAALLLGPMVAGIVVALGGASIRLPDTPFVLAQAVVGCLIARAASPAVLPEFLAHWHLFSLVILAGTLASFNLPAAGVAVILGVDEIMDMARTAINVLGNCLASAVVARWEGQLDTGARFAKVVEEPLVVDATPVPALGHGLLPPPCDSAPR